MNYEFFIARRYLTARRKQAFISVITFISILGITIGVMALVIAISLITGFQQDVQDKILGATSHVWVSDLSGEGLSSYPELIKDIESLKGIKSVTPVAYNTVLINGPYKSLGAMLKGVDFELERRNSSWLQDLEAGEIPETSEEAKPSGQQREGILLGKDLAFSIGANLGDAVTVLAPTFRLSPVSLIPKTKRYVVTGIFSTGLYEFDSATGLVSLSSAQKLFNLDDRVSYLHVMIDDIFKAPRIAEDIKKILPPVAYVTTWMELNKSLFSALKLEKKLLFLTITLIVLVAALNIIATLILMVMEKTRDIGILIAMGAASKSIRKIFFLQGAMIGVVGTVLGVSLGLVWCWLANTFKLIKVPVDIYKISYVPFRIQPLDLILIIVVTLLISFLSTLFPSQRAAKVDPVIALKYE